MRRWFVAGCAALVSFGSVGAVDAHATYAGHPGEVAYLNSDKSDVDPSDYTDYDLSVLSNPALKHATRWSCSGDGGGNFDASSICPRNGVSFSPDGDTIVYGGRSYDGVPSHPGHVQIFKQSTAKGNPVAVRTEGLSSVSYPAFLNSNTLVLSGRTGKNAQPRLYTVPAGGGSATQLSSSQGGEPAPCSDGRVLYDHAGSIYMLTKGQHGVGKLLVRAASMPDCSATSRTFVFVSRGGDLYLDSIDTKHKRRLGTYATLGARPALSPAGGQAVYIQNPPCTAKTAKSTGCIPNDPDQCGPNYLTVVDMNGHVVRRRDVANEGCDLGEEEQTYTDVAWQPTK